MAGVVAIASTAVNGSWLRFATSNQVYLPRFIRPVAYPVAYVVIGLGGFVFFNSLLNPGWLAYYHRAQLIEETQKAVSTALARVSEREAQRAAKVVAKRHRARTIWRNAAVTGISVISVYAGLMLINAMKRSEHADHNADASVANARDQLVYFRSFQSDAAFHEPAAGILSSFAMRTQEEELAHLLGGNPRFYAIGRPGEPLPELGAYRMYFSHETWRSEALQMMQSARIVVIRPHQTPSLLWELEQIVAKVDPRRVVIWLPRGFTLGDWHQFIVATKRIFPQPLPDFGTDEADHDNVFTHSWVIFDADWKFLDASIVFATRLSGETSATRRSEKLLRAIVQRTRDLEVDT